MPGLTAPGLCPLVKPPLAAIDAAYAISQGCTTAYSNGKRAQTKYAQALNAAISTAASNG
jgi:hypothetical protein